MAAKSKPVAAPEKAKRGRKLQVEPYRKLLIERRNELVQSVRDQAQEAPEATLQGATGDSADQAASDYMVELFGALLEKQAGTLEEVELALKKMDAGTYGTCETCREEIAAKRLKAIPWARNCRECQERLDRSNAARRAQNAATASWGEVDKEA